jgi:hypothetical protein
LVGARQLIDLRVAVAEYAQPAVRGVQRGLGRGQIRLGLLPIRQRAALDVVETVLARLGQSRQPELRGSGAQVIEGLRKLAGIDGGQRRALLNLVAKIGDDAGDATGIGRVHGGGAVGVDGDLALGPFLADEGAHSQGFHRQGLELLGSGAKRAGNRSRPGSRVVARSVPGQPVGEDDYGQHAHGHGEYPRLAAPGPARARGGFCDGHSR